MFRIIINIEYNSYSVATDHEYTKFEGYYFKTVNNIDNTIINTVAMKNDINMDTYIKIQRNKK